MIPLFIKSLTKPETRTPTVKVTEPNKAVKKDAEDAAKPGLEHFSHLLGLLSEHKAGGDFGPHNVDVGHHVAFAAGSYTGSGKVSTTGRDGLTVEDEKRREHRVHWREITGHFAPEKSEEKPESKPKKAKSDDGK